MKIKIGGTEFQVSLFEIRQNTVTIHAEKDTNVSSLRSAIEGASEIEYTDNNGSRVCKLVGTYSLKFIGSEEKYDKFIFEKTDSSEHRIRTLEHEKENLENQLTEVQAALCALYETIAEGDVVNG